MKRDDGLPEKGATQEELRHMAQRGLANMAKWFVHEHPVQAVLAAFLFLISSLLDSISILLLLPVLAIIVGETSGEQNWLTDIVFSVLEFLNVPRSIAWILAVIVMVIICKFILRVFAGIVVGNFAARITKQVRVDLLLSMVKAKWALFSREHTGDYIQALVNDAGKTSKASLAMSQGISRLLQIFFLTGTSFLISWQFTLAALVLGGLTTIILNGLVRILKRIAAAQVTSMRLLNSRLIDGINVMKALKAMGREMRFRENVLDSVGKLYHLQRRSIISNELMRLIPEPMAAISIALGMGLLLPYWQGGVESLLTVLYVFMRLHKDISQLPMSLRDIATGQPAFYFVMNLRDATRAFEERQRGNRSVGDWQTLSLNNVSFSYESEPVLQNANLVIKSGEFVTFFGPSGSGKTTTVDLLIGLLEPDEGDICLDDRSLFEYEGQSWRSQIGYVPQDCVLFNGSIIENIRLGDETISEEDVRVALESANALTFVEAMPSGLNTIVSERGLNLSGGQAQRLSIARALVRRPKLLILDEVTSSLDIETEKSICDEMSRLHQNTSNAFTVIAISHRPLIAEISDRVIQIRAGEIIESTEPASNPMLLEGELR